MLQSMSRAFRILRVLSVFSCATAIVGHAQAVSALLHHRYMHKNFNVVLPLADFCLGTLMLRAKTRFLQATGPSVPDVQPLSV